MEKLKYINSNPVKYGLYDEEWDYKFSSATNYTDKQSLIEVILLSLLVVSAHAVSAHAVSAHEPRAAEMVIEEWEERAMTWVKIQKNKIS